MDDPASTIEYNKKKRIQLRLAVSAFYFCTGLCFSSWASRIPDLKSTLHLSAADLGTLLLMIPAGQMCTLPFSGRLVTHFGSKNILSIALVLYVLELTNLPLAASKWQLAVLLFLFGSFANLSNIAVNTQGVSAEKIFGRSIMTSFHGAWSIAGFTGVMIGSLMISLGVGPRVHFFVVAGIILLIGIFVRKFIPDVRHAKPEKKSFFSKPDHNLLQLGIIGFCSMAAEGTMFDWSGVYFKDVVKSPANLVLLGYGSFMIMMAAGRFAGDTIIGRIGRKRMLKISGFTIAGGLLISILLPYLITAALGFLIVGFGVSSVIPTVYSTAGRLSGTSPGRALASVASISFFGFLLGPPMIGYIAELAGLQYSFSVIAVIGLSISLMVSRMKVLS